MKEYGDHFRVGRHLHCTYTKGIWLVDEGAIFKQDTCRFQVVFHDCNMQGRPPGSVRKAPFLLVDYSVQNIGL